MPFYRGRFGMINGMDCSSESIKTERLIQEINHTESVWTVMDIWTMKFAKFFPRPLQKDL